MFEILAGVVGTAVLGTPWALAFWLRNRDRKVVALKEPLPNPVPPESYSVPLNRQLQGKCWVIDGDTIKIDGSDTIRFAGIDAPELGQEGTMENGENLEYGSVVKSKLIGKIGGCLVNIDYRGEDVYKRTVGVVEYKGEDIGRWLVRMGYAIATDERYKRDEDAARERRAGMWALKEPTCPKGWRSGERKPI